MIEYVKVKNARGEELKLKLMEPEESGFVLFNITGIGPEKAEITMRESVTMDGSRYGLSRRPSRNIVLVLKFEDDAMNSIEDRRYKTYKYFPLKEMVRLEIKTDKRHAYIEGMVEANEPVIFVNESYTQISILCADPYFIDIAGKVTVGYGWGTRQSMTIDYKGDVPVGIEGLFWAHQPIGDLYLEISYPDTTWESLLIEKNRLLLYQGMTIEAGDRINIDTRAGSRTANKEGINILNSLYRSGPPNWLMLQPGPQVVSFRTTPIGDVYNLTFDLFYYTLYAGM